MAEHIPGVGPIIHWFRNDLRLSDHPAIHAIAKSGRPAAFVFVREEATPDLRAPGGAKDWWLHHSLAALAADLEKLGVELTLRSGDAATAVLEVARATGANAVTWTRRYGAAEQKTDETVAEALTSHGIAAQRFEGALLHDPDELTTKTGNHYKVYTPFYRAVAARLDLSRPLPAPDMLEPCEGPLMSEALGDWKLLPTAPDWATGFVPVWKPGEEGAQARLREFASDAIKGYDEGRDRPDIEGTSRLSPHLSLGEISPGQALAALEGAPGSETDHETFRKEIAWRDFSYHLLFHHPDMPHENVSHQFDSFPWREGEEAERDLKAWQRGQTGYPIVDAGMRQLYETGWMHNRVRMIVASFLIKHLLIHWSRGEDWFWDTLVDADAANNANGWQWVAGSGADASPYFRVFNPILQGEKFDPEGAYVRQWVPEIAALPTKHVHQPWAAPDKVMSKAGIRLGRDYPEPMVDHKAARQRALEAYAEMRAA